MFSNSTHSSSLAREAATTSLHLYPLSPPIVEQRAPLPLDSRALALLDSNNSRETGSASRVANWSERRRGRWSGKERGSGNVRRTVRGSGTRSEKASVYASRIGSVRGRGKESDSGCVVEIFSDSHD